jgi:hypothetical protein
MSQDYLVDHALKNVWCVPDQDNQIIFQLARLTGYSGVSRSWKALMTSFVVPEPGVRFHLFQIGQVHPAIVDLFPRMYTWTKLSDACMRVSVVCQLYTSTGVCFPLSQAYYMVTEERNIIVAIKELRQIGKYNTTASTIEFGRVPVYMRVYRNAYFNSVRSNAAAQEIYIRGMVTAATADILSMQVDYNQKVALLGDVTVYRNGYKINTLSLVTCKPGDVVEMVRDTSVYKTVRYTVSDLNTFNSSVHSVGKYLLHYPGADVGTIDFQDDIDCFIIDKNTNEGVYYHKNNPLTLRNVTHRDYSTPVSQVRAIIEANPAVLTVQNAVIQLKFRNSGFSRALIDENLRIKELYKLADTNIQSAMLGVDSTVPMWKASTLEASPYVGLMGSNYFNVSKSLVTGAYGYNAIAKLVAEPVLKTYVFSGQVVTKQPFAYQTDCTGFEYDVNGLLLGWSYHVAGSYYNCVNPGAKYVEFIRGECKEILDDYLNVRTIIIDDRYDYRFYTCPKTSNAQAQTWTDVTNDFSKYSIVDGVATWAVNSMSQTLVRTNKAALLYTQEFDLVDGLMEFNLYSRRLINGVNTMRVLEVPMGELDIFLNGRLLIQNLDYFVKYPAVIITNKEYIRSTGKQTVVVRFKGLCKSTLELTDANEFGFVMGGVLSVDHQYDIRDDKVIKIQVNGGIRVKEDLVFNEDAGTFSTLNALNGKPYLIKDVIVPLKDITGEDSYAIRERSRDIDTVIGNYMTAKLGTVNPTGLSPIVNYYKVYSPFICKVMMDLKLGVLVPDFLNKQYSNAQVSDCLKEYTYLLSFDPIIADNLPDQQYVIIHPHCFSTEVNLTIQQYAFMNRVILIYAKGLTELSNYAKIV